MLVASDEKPLKILIADDSDTDRLLLKAIIKSQGHDPLLASDGLEAIEIFKNEHPDIILLDAVMPNLDGFDTARFIKANMGAAFVPIIFLTSLNEADSLAQCLEAGGDDFLTKPYHSVILRAKIKAFKRMLDMHNTLANQKNVIEDHNLRLIREQEIAKRTFDKVAHEGMLHAHNIEYSLSPMAVFNGDVLLAAVRPNGNLCVLLGDFTGHGLAAAIGAMPLSQTFYSMTAKGFPIRDIVTELNKKLKDILPVGIFCCAVVIDMDFSNESIEIWNGGMPETYIFSAHDKSLQPMPSSHLALGILPAHQFISKTTVLKMKTGDQFFMWSDGIIEAENPDGEMFGQSAVEELFQEELQAGHSYLSRIVDTVNHFVAESEMSDDISIAEITMVSKEAFDDKNPRRIVTAPLSAMDWAFSYEVRRTSLKTTDPLPIIQKLLLDAPSFRGRIGAVFTVLTELYSNALEHGILKLDSSMKKTPDGFAEYYELREQRIRSLNEGFIRFDIDYVGDDFEGKLLIRVTDSGEGFDFESVAALSDIDSKSFKGRGLLIIRNLCDQLRFIDSGNIVEVEFL